MNKLLSAVLIILTLSCNSSNKKEEIKPTTSTTSNIVYSQFVKDSFYINISLPNKYSSSKNYPVMYVLDGNIYFDILNATLRKYEDVGLAPEMILVGIGYKDYQLMDSLRNRDYTFPTALPKYEMFLSGGANKLSSFINNELKPLINKNYKTDLSKQILFGHSLGGYFTMYSLMQDLKTGSSNFQYYIAASPSLHYNNYYLLNEFKLIESTTKTLKTKAYITFGEQEEKEDEDDKDIITQKQLKNQIQEMLINKYSKCLDCKLVTFSNLEHFDTPVPTFTKALKEMFSEND